MKKELVVLILALLFIVLLNGCAGPKGQTIDEEAQAKFIPEHCVISAGSGLACENFRTTAGTGITLRIKNILSENVFVDSIILDSPSCTFSTTTEIIVGATTDFLLSCPSIELGDKIKATISINYKIGDSDLKKETTGDLNAKVV